MPNKTSHARAKCPYFRGDSKMSIACEPHMRSTRINRSEFYNEYGRRRHEERYCFGFGYSECPYAKLLDDKYKEEEKQ